MKWEDLTKGHNKSKVLETKWTLGYLETSKKTRMEEMEGDIEKQIR